ncbi:MAG: M48 family metalloprotease [Candidatus Yanofskybacteria bacterium]|nr:M48 family metalloprotease [Candidatus Yanofskybacteria bacterium]
MSVTLNDLVLSQNQEFKKPTFEEIYQSYSFLDTANLAEIVKYPEEDIKKEFERLREKEKTERLEAKTEQRNALAELKKSQNNLKKNSDATEKLRKKYTVTATVIENNKPRKDKRVDENALANDPAYKTLSEERKGLECLVREWQIKSDKVTYEIKLEKIRTYYEVLETQLDLLQKWPVALQKIEADKQSGKAAERKFANPENIGLRDLGVGDQSDDLKKFSKYPEIEADRKEFKKIEYKDQEVRNYVLGMVQLIAKNSDLTIPIKDENVIIIDTEDVNAFAYPGGLIIGINRGLLLHAENEAQLAGVLAHEISHVVARHGHRLMKKVNLWSLAQLASLFIPGGYLVYVISQNLLGFFLNLKLLGVSRGFEIEADILGMQYLEKTGYDPMSYMNFFEKLGRDKGYVRHTSWFKTHPASEERITNTLREYRYLTPKDSYVQNSNDFLEMQARLCVAQELEKADTAKRAEKQRKPSLTRGQQKKEENADKQCGIQKTPPEQKNSPCNRPELSDFKDKVRAEVTAEKEKQEKVEEEPKPKLRRP